VKIQIIHQHYLMPGQPGGSRFNEFARMWAAAGHEVTVIAGTLNYTTGDVPETYRGKWTVKEHDGAVAVIRAHVPRTYMKNYAGRMWAFLGFTLSSITAVLQAPRPDVIIATSPPLITAITGWFSSRMRFKRVPWVFEIRDLWPESAITSGVLSRGGVLAKILYAIERRACRRADRINVLTPAFRDDLLRRGLAPDSKIVFVPNGADSESFQPGPRDNEVRRELGWGDRFVVMYAGAHGRANALAQLVEAAELLRERRDILIVSVGDGPERAALAEDVQRRGLANIVFHGAVPKERMPLFVNASDAGAAVLQDNPTFRTVYPNKVFDYMACERPTLLAIDGVARQLVCDQANAGVFARPEDPADIARCIVQLEADRDACRTMGRSGRKWVLENATRTALAARYASILESMVAGNAK
jgi:glycosyltransferase involved in cell wall biosynthesis